MAHLLAINIDAEIMVAVEDEDAIPRVVFNFTMIAQTVDVNAYLMLANEEVAIVAVFFVGLEQGVVRIRVLHLDIHHDGVVLRCPVLVTHHLESCVFGHEDGSVAFLLSCNSSNAHLVGTFHDGHRATPHADRLQDVITLFDLQQVIGVVERPTGIGSKIFIAYAGRGCGKREC